MALNFDFGLFQQAEDRKKQNQQDLNQNIQGLGQSLGGIGNTIAQSIQERKKQDILKQLVQAMNSQTQPIPGPEGYIPPGAGQNAVPAGQTPDMSGKIQSLATQLDPAMGMKMYMQGQKFKPGLGKRTIYETTDGSISLTPVDGATPLVVSDAQALQYSAKTPSKNAGTDLSKVTWESASPDEQGLAKSVYDGNVLPKDIGFRERSRIIELANIYGSKDGRDPFQSFTGSVKEGSAKSFSTGKLGQNALALNTALGHVNSAYDSYKKIGNTDQKWLNVPLNKLKKQTGDGNVVKLGITLNALRGELATVFKGSSGTDQDAASWRDYLTDDLTPTQINAAIPQVDELLRSRLSALEYQRKSGMSGRGKSPLLSPHAAEISKRLGSSNIKDSKPKQFLSVEQAEAANLPPGTKVMIGGRSATIQ